MKLETCPCSSGKKYAQCCQIVHQDITQALTCEQLMRARYSAFALKNEGFLRESWHSTTQPSILEPIISPDVAWLGL
jgi:SEC-C motif-containing protein